MPQLIPPLTNCHTAPRTNKRLKGRRWDSPMKGLCVFRVWRMTWRVWERKSEPPFLSIRKLRRDVRPLNSASSGRRYLKGGVFESAMSSACQHCQQFEQRFRVEGFGLGVSGFGFWMENSGSGLSGRCTKSLYKSVGFRRFTKSLYTPGGGRLFDEAAEVGNAPCVALQNCGV